MPTPLKSLDPILRAMMPDAPQCPEPAGVQAVIQTATKFCRATGIWRELIDDLPVSPDDDAILPLQPGVRIHEIEFVRWTAAGYNGNPLEPISFQDLETLHPGWRDWTPGVPTLFSQRTWNTIRLVPGAYGDVAVSLICFPDPEATTLPDFLVRDHRDALASGALARVLLTRDTPYFDPQMAATHKAIYQEAEDDAYAAQVRGQQKAQPRVRGRYF